MVAIWSDNDTSYSDDNEDQVAKEEHGEEQTECESSNEADYSVFLEYSKDELAQALVICIEYEQKYLSKIKFLKKTIGDSSFKKEALQKSKDELHIKIDTLKEENKEVESKCKDFEKLILKFWKE